MSGQARLQTRSGSAGSFSLCASLMFKLPFMTSLNDERQSSTLQFEESERRTKMNNTGWRCGIRTFQNDANIWKILFYPGPFSFDLLNDFLHKEVTNFAFLHERQFVHFKGCRFLCLYQRVIHFFQTLRVNLRRKRRSPNTSVWDYLNSEHWNENGHNKAQFRCSTQCMECLLSKEEYAGVCDE